MKPRTKKLTSFATTQKTNTHQKREKGSQHFYII